jgi:hypothetical protein
MIMSPFSTLYKSKAAPAEVEVLPQSHSMDAYLGKMDAAPTSREER